MRMGGGLSGVVGIGAAALVLVLTLPHGDAPAESGEAAVPRQLAGYSHLTADVSDSASGPAVALFQHGWGVELLDFPQAVVLGAGGDVYRRLDVAEDRAGDETQGDPAPMLLSPDGTRVAVGDHDIARPDVVVVDLRTGTTTSHPLPAGRSVVPLAWSGDGETLATLLSAEPTNPYLGERITGDVALLDLTDDSTRVLDEDGEATAVAFSPDGSELAVERTTAGAVSVSVLELVTDHRRPVAADGVLAGPSAWSPDGGLLALTTVRPADGTDGIDAPGIPTGLAFADPTGGGGAVPGPLTLPLPGAGRVLGWSGADEVVLLLDVEGHDPCCGPEAYDLSRVPLDGAAPGTLMRVPDLQDHGVGRFQMAAGAVGDLRQVTPGDVDRGPWPLWLRLALAGLVGLLARLVVRVVVRRSRARTSDPGPMPDSRAPAAAGALTDPPR